MGSASYYILSHNKALIPYLQICKQGIDHLYRIIFGHRLFADLSACCRNFIADSNCNLILAEYPAIAVLPDLDLDRYD